MASIRSSVGRDGVNSPKDVRLVQDLLNGSSHPPKPALTVDGQVSPRTIAAIESFQKHVLDRKRPDGRVDPEGRTLAMLVKNSAAHAMEESKDLPEPRSGARLGEGDYLRAAQSLACEVACVKAVTEVESRGGGFLASARPKILFEAHIFSKRTQHKYDTTHPDVSSAKWDKKLYKGGEKEYARLAKAMSLDRRAALESASWGLFQIMGFHYRKTGFASIDAYVEAMFESEGRQLDAFINFIQANGLDERLRSRRWAEFAKGYNGPRFAENQYDRKLQTAYEKHRALG
ncbi:MAG: DUF3380 domain-containing protein [Sterolibacteriaceae bacterium]|uniref:DUF3380 domain-containing protein n=1 Tax=Candidatus Methylophosphatis roskildensis TaxID=2899263 RepID=A0A9D7E2Q6_9PROT|nr:DUF3380 domain-containing protein [Candidatus Methylophosphatis roskildensis]MBK7237572.1 DUF3380 domain-containing protein [Sterolibacteriaceae bacterium]